MKRAVFFAAFAVAPLFLLSCATPRGQAPPHEPVIVNGMVVVDQGKFIMGSDEGEINEKPEHEVFVSDFLIDRYEVSARDFAAFLNERGNPDDAYFSVGSYSTLVLGDDGKYAPRDGYGTYPANNVTWHGASAYCGWVYKRLPSEAEWEKAARGDDVRTFPWGEDAPDRERARYDQTWSGGGLGVLTPVDSLPGGASYYGAINMAGNVWEWTGDWYRQNYCSFCSDTGLSGLAASRLLGREYNTFASQWEEEMDDPERADPKGPPFGDFKVLRGGSWSDDEKLMKVTVRYWRLPEERGMNMGFRCARDPERR